MSHESWNDENDFLSGALRGAADEMPGAEVDDLHVSFGVVRDRVRRRRAAKIGGLAGVSLVLVGGIAFGATQTALLGRSEPVPPGTSQNALRTPDVSPSASADPTRGTDFGLREGYTPDWLTGTGLECGMPVSDLEERATAGEYGLEVRGDLHQTAEADGDDLWFLESILPVRLMWDAVDGVDDSPAIPPVLVWSVDGQVVDLGDERAGEEPVPVEPEGRYSGARESRLTTCTDGPLPDGQYDVRALTEVHPIGGQEPSLAMSDPVTLTIENGEVHQNPGNAGAAPFEVPESGENGLTSYEPLGSAVVDRTGPWERDITYSRVYDLADGRQWYPEDGEQFTIEARCTSSDPSDEITFRAAGWLTSAGGGAESSLPCDGEPITTPVLTASSAARQDLDDVGAVHSAYLPVSFIEVPDGVTLAYAIAEPASADGGGTDGGNTAAECSASSFDPDLVYDPANSPTAAAGTTAQLIVAAAVACDSEQLIQLATEHSTQLMYGNETPEQVFGLPENETLPYETLVRLLTGTTGVVNGGDAGNETITWPRVSTEEFADSDDAWEEVVSAGLLTQADADAQRADETFGYTGMVIGIDESGTWRYYESSD